MKESRRNAMVVVVVCIGRMRVWNERVAGPVDRLEDL